MARICDQCGARLLGANGVHIETARGPEEYCRVCWKWPTHCAVCGEFVPRDERDVRRVTVGDRAIALHWRCEEAIFLAYLRAKAPPAVGAP